MGRDSRRHAQVVFLPLAPSFRTAVRTCVQLSGLSKGRLSCEELNPNKHDGRTKRYLAAVASLAVTCARLRHATAVVGTPPDPDIVEPVLTHLLRGVIQSGYADGPYAILYTVTGPMGLRAICVRRRRVRPKTRNISILCGALFKLSVCSSICSLFPERGLYI